MIAVVSDATLAAPFDMFRIGANWATASAKGDSTFIAIAISKFAADVSRPAIRRIDSAQLEEVVGEIAGNLGVIPTQLGKYRSELIKLATPRQRLLSVRSNHPKRTLTMAFIGVLIGGTFGVLATRFTGPSKRVAESPVAERLGFEEGTVFWSTQLSRGALGFGHAVRSDTKAHSGRYSLQVDLDLKGVDTNHHVGEVLLDLRKALNLNSVDLAGKSVTLWVYVPAGGEGEKAHPNGLQIFVKDRNWRSQYALWSNVCDERWTKLTLAVDSPNGPGRAEDGFRPDAIVAIGAKMSLGEGSESSLSGKLYLDSVFW